jgi:hypothetical protein
MTRDPTDTTRPATNRETAGRDHDNHESRHRHKAGKTWWLWTELIRHAPPAWIAPVATLIAATAYQRGHAPLARVAAEHALVDDPAYTMAGFVLIGLNRRMHPATFTRLISDALASAYPSEGA